MKHDSQCSAPVNELQATPSNARSQTDATTNHKPVGDLSTYSVDDQPTIKFILSKNHPQVESENYKPSTPAHSGLESKRITSMIMHPLEARHISVKHDWSYTLIGILLGSIGFSAWAFLVAGHFTSLLPESPSVSLYFFVKCFLLVIAMYGALFVSLWVSARLSGSKQFNLLETIVWLGAMQMPYGIGFLIAAIVSFASFQISLGLVVILCVTAMIVCFIEVNDLARIDRNKRFQFTIIASAFFLILAILLFNLVP